MDEEKLLKQAKSVYATICKALDSQNWNYTEHEEDLVITTAAKGEDLPVNILIRVRPNVQAVSLISPMPFKVQEDKRVDLALAVSLANYGLINGSFDIDLSDGEIRFRITSSYRGSILGEELFIYMIMIACHAVDDYNDRFLMVAKGAMTIPEFIEWQQERLQKK